MSAPSGYQFVDTNVLVYAHDTSAGAKHERAARLLEESWESRLCCLSIQVLQEFYVSITRKVAHPLESSAAAQIITDLSVWRVHVPGVNDVLAAIEIQRRFDLAFWDAMILQSAVRLRCEIVWSEDLNSGQIYDSVRAVNPFEA
ncbi:MAG: PIN domain-containing protein [Acidobacteria bacterium]|nr:PIN domain-containing protein [Acidobacteriota bacterium]